MRAHMPDDELGLDPRTRATGAKLATVRPVVVRFGVDIGDNEDKLPSSAKPKHLFAFLFQRGVHSVRPSLISGFWTPGTIQRSGLKSDARPNPGTTADVEVR